MIKYWFIIAMSFLMLASCGDTATESVLDNAKHTDLPATNATGNEVVLLWNDYLKVRDALVAGNSAEASKWATALELTASKFPIKFNDNDQLRWNRQQKDIVEDALAISAGDLEAQREAFEPLSKTMYQVVTEMGLPKGTHVYQQHCPMAFDNRGAWWLSDKADIVNPYFGEKMLTCGVVKEAIKFN